MQNKFLYIEFIGLPGAGKTTTLKEILGILESDGYNIISNNNFQLKNSKNLFFFNKVLKYMKMCIKYILITFAAMIYSLNIKPFNKESMLRALRLPYKIGIINDACHYASINNTDIIILDQGIIQDLWSLSVTGKLPREKMISFLIKRILVKTYISQVVFFQIDSSTAMQRIINRPTFNSRFDKIPLPGLKSLLKEKEAHLNKIINELEKNNVKVFKVDAINNSKDTAIKIYRFIKHI